ncbi:sirohydrochlorin chelatase [Arthrobacter crystallopoietes]|uniref:Sirohydrochlorin ferrochelatase n=1 Tax=Crystallibacter crystallopoietes TaxID=37928 RepID=A0A1H0ZD72_9MICC|nr:CbiX/SirB N-terminal domain-containing protein [Arthrobacter crystallopoietes]SDQ25056.1 Sirohydrochlorin ferrochelatase [Arthrobacter crystallopoietes]
MTATEALASTGFGRDAMLNGRLLPRRPRRIPLPAPDSSTMPDDLVCEPWGGLVDVHTAASLVGASHGTSSPAGQAAIGNLVRAVARRRPDLNVAEAFVDVQQPDVSTVLGRLKELRREAGAEERAAPGGQTRIVPLLLSAGYHVHVDLAEVAAGHEGVSVARALGPDQRLVKVLARRLQEAGLRRGDHVILGAAGSTDARAVADCETMALMLGKYLGMKVATGYISASQPELKSAVSAGRARISQWRFAARNARVLVATYLLAPGYFASLAAGCGADVVTDPLLVPDRETPAELVNLVLERFIRG